jgi:hypothetical protein
MAKSIKSMNTNTVGIYYKVTLIYMQLFI